MGVDGWGVPTQPARIYEYRDGPQHGPVYLSDWTASGQPRVQAWCASCDWEGPDRSGDPHQLDLADDDAIQHLHSAGGTCGACESCRTDGALR
jgi:hypothetical protein